MSIRQWAVNFLLVSEQWLLYWWYNTFDSVTKGSSSDKTSWKCNAFFFVIDANVEFSSMYEDFDTEACTLGMNKWLHLTEYCGM